jgi:hypothetical protein
LVLGRGKLVNGMDAIEARTRRMYLELALPDYPLAFDPLRDPAVERARFPALIGLYWGLVGPDGLPPRQGAFMQAVADHESLAELPREAVIARAGRTYPSLVRQHHFELLLRERFPFVLRGHQLDLAGLDFLLFRGNRGYGVGLSVETAAGRAWHDVKDTRHGVLPVPVLDLYAEPDAYRIGRFWLHPAEDVDRVEAFIEREEGRVFEYAEFALDEVYRATKRRPRCSRADFNSGFFAALGHLREALRRQW